MECPNCGQELNCTDFYGRNLRLNSFGNVREGFVKKGDIFKCNNDECEACGESFYTDSREELHEGYPC